MIPKTRLHLFCCEDISLIENYEKAKNDDTQIWDCHHRLETDLGLSKKQLKDKNLYYNRPASELIFLTHGEHSHLHHNYDNNPLIGRELSDEHKQHISESHKGEKHPFYGKKHKEESKNKISETKKRYYKTHDAPIKGKHKVWDNKELNKYHYEL